MATRTERMLLEDVEDLGWIGLRAPASGARPGSDAGDLWVGKRQDFYDRDDNLIPEAALTELVLIEEKYKSSKKNRYIQHNGDRLDSMIALAEELGATPVIAARWSTRMERSPGATHYICDAREVRRTDAGNVNLAPSTAAEEWETTREYFG